MDMQTGRDEKPSSRTRVGNMIMQRKMLEARGKDHS